MVRNKYDCAVIGAGIAGIAAALELASDGKKVVIIDKQKKAGGYFSGFQNEYGDKFDYAISYLLSCGEGDVVYNFLKKVGLHETVKFKKLITSDEIYIKDRHFIFGIGEESFKRTLVEQFPQNQEEIINFVKWLEEYLNGVSLQGKNALNFFLRNFRKNYEEFLNKMVTNDLLKAVLSVRIQADPASLMIMAGFLCECYFKGMYYPEGGASELVDKLMRHFYKLGGVFYNNEEVVKLEESNDKIISAITLSGKTIYADSFIYNGDILNLYKRLVSNKFLYYENTKRKIGHSSINIYLAVKDYDLSRFTAGRIYLTESENIFSIYKKLERGKIPLNNIIKVHIPSNHDNTLSKEKHGIIRIESDIFYNEENDLKDEFIKYSYEMLKYVEKKLFPNILKHIVYKKVITPVDFKMLFGHTSGSGTGWAHTTQNMMISKKTQKTPYSNLFIVGQWGEFGSGIRQLILSAEKTVQYVNELKHEKD